MSENKKEYWEISMAARPSARTPEDRKLYRAATFGKRTDGFKTEAEAQAALEQLPPEVQKLCRVNKYPLIARTP